MSQSFGQNVLFIHQVKNGVRRVVDREGVEFPSVAAARDEAVLAARQMMAETLKHHGYVDLACSYEIANSDDEILEILMFSDAIEIRD